MITRSIIRGGLAVLLLLALAVQVLAYAGIVKINKANVLSGVTVYVFGGTRPNQKSDQNSPGALVLNTNYSIDDTNDPIYRIYNIYNSPSEPAYLLLLNPNTNTYAILSASLGTTVPETTTFNTAKFYKTGKPVAPTITTIEAGYETAKAEMSYSGDYEYSGVDIAVWDYEKNNSIGTTTSLGGKPTDYKIGELVDGRKLETDANGKKYKFQIQGKVDGVDPSDWATMDFNTKGLGAAGPQTFTLTLESGVPGKPGINFFAMPFAGPWYVYKEDGSKILHDGTTNEVTNAYHLIKAINVAKGSKVVSTFGKWDKTNQSDAGVLIANNDPDSDPAKSALQNISLQQGEGYQVYVTQKVTLVIKNTP